MIRLVLWLFWLYCVIELYKWLANNWDAVAAAPGAFIFFFLLSCVVTFAINYWAFSERFKGTRQQILGAQAQTNAMKEQLIVKDERLKSKDEQIQELQAKIKAYSDEAEARAAAIERKVNDRYR